MMNYQMIWDCPKCKSGPLQGLDDKYCPNCGKGQEPRFRYFPDQEDAKPAFDWISAGPDHYCPYCNNTNSIKAVFCRECGGPMDGSKPVELREDNYGTKAETIEDAIAEARREDVADREALYRINDPFRPSNDFQYEIERKESIRQDNEWWEGVIDEPDVEIVKPKNLDNVSKYKQTILIGGAFLSFLLILWAIFGWEKTITAEVTSRSWSRSIVVEKFVQLSQTDWCKSAPSDAHIFSQWEEQNGWKTVVDCHDCDCKLEKIKTGETCHKTNCSTSRRDNGDGTYAVSESCDKSCTDILVDKKVCKDKTHQEPVFENKCSYHINRWRKDRVANLNGSHKTVPTWPALSLNTCVVTHLDCEREKSRKENYKVFFRDVENLEDYSCSFSQKAWDNYEEGSQWKATVKMIGGRFQCDTVMK